MEKNTAGKWIVFAYGLPDHASDGQPITGDAANITANIRIDGGAANAVDDVNPTELEDGYYVFDVTAAEANGDLLSFHPVSSTANVQVIGVPGAVWTRPANFNALGIETDGDLTKCNLVATTTTNTDMRGTDSAATATALATAQTDLDTITGTDGATLATAQALYAPAKAGDNMGTVSSVTGNVDGNVTGSVGSNLELGPTEVNAEVDTAIETYGLDHLVSAAVIGTDVTDNSIVAKLVSSSATADWDDFVNTSDSLQATRDHIGDGTNLTEAGGTGDQLTGITGVQLAADQAVDATKFGGAAVTATTSVTIPAASTLATTTGAVGSVTGSVGSNVELGPTEVLAQVNAALDTAISELGVGAPTATPDIREALMLMYMALRNKTVVQTSGTDALEIYNDAGTKIASKVLTDDGSDYTEAEMS